MLENYFSGYNDHDNGFVKKLISAKYIFQTEFIRKPGVPKRPNDISDP